LAAALEGGDATAAPVCCAGDAEPLTPAAGLIQGRKAIEEYCGTGIALGLSSVSFDPDEPQSSSPHPQGGKK